MNLPVEGSQAHQIDAPMPSELIQLTEIEQLAHFFPNWRGEIEQISSGKFSGRLRVVKGNVVRIATVAFNQRLVLRGQVSSGMTAVYPVIDRRSTNSWRTCLLRPGQILVEGPEQEIKHYTSNHTLDWGVHFRADVLKDADRTLWNADGMALPCAWAVYSTPPEAMADLMHHLNRMLDLGPATPALLESPDGCKLEQECIRALVVALSGPTEPPERLTLPARSELVGRAEEFLRTRLGETVGMIDLCRAIGANARTLRLAFQERYGLGPMTYFRSLRLNAARRMLRENEDIMIADVAREFGFHHLGNFAADYRRLFGVLPSKTRHPPAT